MSREIDERVVQMRLDSEQFERNVKSSVDSLDKLKKGLNFDDSVKGFEELDRSARSVNIGALGKAVDQVRLKFSLFDVFALNVMNRISNAAVNTGEQLVKSLSIDQITPGWDKYADKTTAVQTIMAATAKQFTDTGEQMAFVNGQLDKLNWFTDETSYNFVDMVSNIGKFTSNNIKLDASVTAMQGIANWAAISGANANDASRAMYNLSQAISSGVLRLEDWMSIENANMGTAAFKEMAIQSAVTAGILVKNGDKITTANGKMEVSVESFRNTLSEKWLTNDVLMDVLNQYGGATNKLNELYEKTGVLTSQLVSDIDDYTAGIKSADDISKDWGLTLEETQKHLDEFNTETMQFGLKAFKAAQEAKTFEDAINSVKDAVSTGWMKSFEYIFGDYLEAKELWTDLANNLYDIFASGSEARNEMLEMWKNDGGRDLFVDSIWSALADILAILNPIKAAWYDIFGKMTSDRLIAITEKIHNLLDALYLTDEASEDLRRTFRGLFATLAIFKTLVGGGLKIATSTIRAIFSDLDISVLGFTGNIGDSIVALRDWLKEGDRFDIFVDAIIKHIQNAVMQIKAFVKAVKEFGPVKAVIDSFSDAFTSDFKGISSIVEFVLGLLESFWNSLKRLPTVTSFSDLLAIIKDFGKSIKEKLDDVGISFEGLGKLGDTVFSSLGELLSQFAGNMTIATTAAGNGLGFLSEQLNKVDWAGVALMVTGVAILAFMWKFVDALRSIATSLTMPAGVLKSVKGMTDSIKTYFTTLNKNAQTNNTLKTAVAVGVLAAAFFALSRLSWGDIGKGAVAIVALAGSLFVLNLALSKLKIDSGKFNTSVLSISASLMILAIALNSIKVDETLGQRLGVLIGLVATMGGLMLALDKFTSKQLPGIANFIGLAAGLYVMVAALNKLSKIDARSVYAVLPALAIVMLMLTAFTRLTSGVQVFSKEFQKAKPLTSFANIIAMAVALNLVIGAIKRLGKMNPEVLVKGILALIPIFVSMSTLFLASRVAGKNASKAGLMMLAVAAALNLMIGAIKGLGKMDPAIMDRGLAAVRSISLIFGALMAFSSLSGYNAAKVGLMFIEMAGAMALLQLVIKTLGKVEAKELVKGVAAISAVMLAFTPLIAASSGSFSVDTVKSLTKLTIIVGILGGLIIAIAGLSKLVGFQNVLSASAAISAVLLSMAGSMRIANEIKAPKMGDLLKMTAFITMMGVVITAVAVFTNPQDALAAAGAMSGLILAVSASGVILNKAKIPTKTQATALAIYVGSLGTVVAALAGVLGYINSKGGSIDGMLALTTGLSEILFAVAASGIILNKAKFPTEKRSAALAIYVGAVGAVVAVLAGVLGVINANGGSIDGMLKLTTGMSELMIALAASSVILNKTGRIDASTAKNVAILGVIVAALGGLFAWFSNWADPTKLIPMATAMSELILALSAVTLILSRFGGVINPGAVAVFGVLSAITAVMGMVLAGLSSIVNPDTVLPVAIGLSAVMLALSGVVNILTMTPPSFLTGAWSSLAMLGTIVAALGTLAIGLGYLMEDPGFAKAIGNADGGMIALGKAIGGFIGGIVGGFASGALSFLPDLGLYLSQFMLNATPFFTAIRVLPDGIGETVAGLAAALLALTAADLISGLANFASGLFGQRDDNLTNSFEQFGKAISAFSASLTGDIDTDKVMAAANAGKALAELENALPRKGGKLQEWLGEKDLQNFSSRIVLFGFSIRAFATTVAGLDTDAVEAATAAGKSLAELENSLPPQSGKLQEWVGKKDLAEFGTRLVKFGTAIVSFSDTVKGKVNNDAVQAAVNSGSILADLEKSLPPQDGLLQGWIGSSSFENFGPGLSALATGLAEFSKTAAEIDLLNVSLATSALKALVELEGDVDESGGFGEIFTGKSDFSKFGQNLEELGDSLERYSTSIADVDTTKIASATTVMAGIIEMAQKDTSGVVTFSDNLYVLSAALNDYDSKVSAFDTVKMEETRQAIEDLMRLSELTTAAAWSASIILHANLMISKLTKSVQDRYPDIREAGEKISYWLIQGVRIGLDDNYITAEDAATNLGTRIVRALEARLEIASPSAVMEEDGKWIVRGIAEGITNDTSAEDAIKKKADNIKAAFEDALKDINLTADSASLSFQLWQLTEGKNASDSEIFAKQLEVHQADLDALLMAVQTQQGIAEGLKQLYGEQSTEYKQAMNEVMQAQINLMQKVNEVDEYQASIDSTVGMSDRERMVALAERMKEYSQIAEFMGWTDEEVKANAAAAEGFDLAASRRYQQILTNGQEMFQRLQWSTEQIEAYARENSGFTGWGNEQVKQDILDTTYYVQEAFKEQSVTIEQAVAETTTTAMRNGVTRAVSNATSAIAPAMEANGATSAKDYVQGAVNALSSTDTRQKIKSGAEKLGIQLDNWVSNGLGVESPSWKAYENAEWYIQGLVNGLIENSPLANRAADQVVNQVAGPFEALKPTLTRHGQNAMQGFTKGINDMGKTAIGAANRIALEVANTMASALDINSPSRVTRSIGNNAGEGLALGIIDKMAYVNQASEDMADNAASTLAYAYQAIDDIVKNDDDFQPVITPVLNMDTLKSQAGSIDGILRTHRGIDMTATRTRLGYMYAKDADRTDQNGNNNGIGTTNYNFTQNNYSPKSLSRTEIYRQTNNQFARLKGATRK